MIRPRVGALARHVAEPGKPRGWLIHIFICVHPLPAVLYFIPLRQRRARVATAENRNRTLREPDPTAGRICIRTMAIATSPITG